MERVEHIEPRAAEQRCIIMGGERGPFVDIGRMVPPDDLGHWFVSQRAILAMAKVLDLPTARDVAELEAEIAKLREQVTNLGAERDSLQRIVAAHRHLLGFDEIPSPAQLDAAEALVSASARAPEVP